MLAAQALVEPGDNVVMVAPSWPNIARAVEIMGGEVRMAPLAAGNAGWRLDLDALFAAATAAPRRSITPRPAIRRGGCWNGRRRERLLAFARDRGIALLADEVYHRIIYDRPVAPSLLEIAQPEDQVYVLNSFSKAWAMTGWRLGWFVYPAGQTANVEKLVQFNTSGGPGFLQAGAVAALREGEGFVQSFVARCRAGRDLTEGRLAGMPRVRHMPRGPRSTRCSRWRGCATRWASASGRSPRRASAWHRAWPSAAGRTGRSGSATRAAWRAWRSRWIAWKGSSRGIGSKQAAGTVLIVQQLCRRCTLGGAVTRRYKPADFRRPPRRDGGGEGGTTRRTGPMMLTLPPDYRPSENDDFMNPLQVEYFRQKLLRWRAELLREADGTLASLSEGGIREADVTDRASVETDRALELRTRDRARKLIAKIDQALARIEAGTYGYCEETGEPIGIKRLEARPIATLSIEAQERHERMERVHRDD